MVPPHRRLVTIHAQVGTPTRPLYPTVLQVVRARRFALGAVFLYQVILLYRFEHQQDLRVGLKAFLKAA